MRTLVVVPCYNEASRLDLPAFQAYLEANSSVEFRFVDDGSSDGTLKVLGDLVARWPTRVGVLEQPQNRGKAEAVRVGVLAAIDEGADYVGYFDADLATPLSAIASFVRTLEEHPEIELVLGSRVALLGRQIERKPLRHYLGRVFATAASLVLNLAVYDTQCGAKLMRANTRVRALFEEPFGSRWIFDVEILARHLVHGANVRSIYELPLDRWEDIGASHVKTSDFMRAGAEMAHIYRRYRLPRTRRWLFDTVSAPFLRYAGAGGVGTLVHYGTLAAVVEVFAVSPAVGTFSGALLGAAVNYMLNYHLTFASTRPHTATLPKFLAVAILSAAVNASGVWFATKRLGAHYLAAQVVCTFGVLLLGYVLNRTWTFRQRTAGRTDDV